jgi:hypothetical protein
VWAILKNLWTRLLWFGFGIQPNILNESQVEITVKDCVKEFMKKSKEIRPAEYGAMSAKEERMAIEDMETYTRWVIEQYILNFKLPKA